MNWFVCTKDFLRFFLMTRLYSIVFIIDMCIYRNILAVNVS